LSVWIVAQQSPENAPAQSSARTQAQMKSNLALKTDPADLKVFSEANCKLSPPTPGENRVVFLGDSITASWGKSFCTLFPGNPANYRNNILSMLDLAEFNKIWVLPLSIQVVTFGKSGLLPGGRTILDRDRPWPVAGGCASYEKTLDIR
jgi:hypothetical protein